MASLVSIRSIPEETLKNSCSVVQLFPDKDKNGNRTTTIIGITNQGFEKHPEDSGSENGEGSESGVVVGEGKGGESGGRPGKEKHSGFFKQYAGMIFTLVASGIMSSVIVLVKMLREYGFNGAEASFWRYAGTTFPALPLLLYYQTCGRWETNKAGDKVVKKPSVFHTVWPMNEDGKWKTVVGLLMRGILGASSVLCRYFSLGYLTIGDASVISYSSPVLVTILAHFFLGEKTGIVPIFTALMALVGVAVITRPPILTGEQSFDPNLLIGTGFAVGSLICSAIMTVITRKIRAVQFSLMMTVFGTIGMIEALILTSVTDGFSFPVGVNDTLMLGGVVFLSFLGQMAIIMGLKFEQAGPVSLIRTCDVVFGFILQFIVLGVTPNLFSAIGGSIVFLGVLITALRKYIATLPPEHCMRRTFKFLLL